MKKKQLPLKKTIAFLGGGNMAEALIKGMADSGLVSPARIVAADIRPERRAYLSRTYRIKTRESNPEAVRASDVIFIAVKPQQIEGLLREIGHFVSPRQLVISIAAGITSGYIEHFLPRRTAVVRAMPNTPALIGQGAIGIAKGKHVPSARFSIAKKLFEASGAVAEFAEKDIDAVTALSGSGPAYVFYLAEAMVESGVGMGLKRLVAEALVAKTILGAGMMLASPGKSRTASELRRKVTSPGGTTEAAISHLEKKKWAAVFADALARAKERSHELSR